jgi:ABC-type multidrug transport system fused ATPase/permease subunit
VSNIPSRNWTSLELDLNSVERIVEYLELPKQPPSVIENSRPPAYWPSSTTKNDMIAVKDLVIRYAPDLPNVLHGVTFSLRGQERVGLLGRTGSGKSTLAMSILRFVSGIPLARAVLSSRRSIQSKEASLLTVSTSRRLDCTT